MVNLIDKYEDLILKKQLEVFMISFMKKNNSNDKMFFSILNKALREVFVLTKTFDYIKAQIKNEDNIVVFVSKDREKMKFNFNKSSLKLVSQK